MMATKEFPIQFHFINTRFSFPHRTQSKELILKLLKKEGKKAAHINYIFCTDDYLLQLNIAYLNHDTLTDIITFQYSAAHEPIHSDIYISIDRVRENAALFGTTFKQELYRVLFHGALHLCGYKDKTKKDQQLMREKENHYLELFHVSRGTLAAKNKR